MAKDGKFGMFGGVFTPSILTILGVIMYLRLPWVVGNGGLVVALAIIVVAHVVSVATGLSISSIATDKKVGAGGPYYIISRSFGLAIGGSIGLALFLGLSFSISLYVIGFSESMLPFLDLEPTATNIRLCGTATIVGLTVITFISTSLAIRAQYVILMLIVLSLGSIFLGSGTATAPLTSAPAGGAEFPVLFGIFFPAVTGFTAGVNMSGDLRDPKTAIPKGTMAAIVVGLAVYTGLGIFLAYRVDDDALRNDPQVLQHIALSGPLVVAGVWGATLSSALGSILGAPRILQAMSRDRITPRVFAKGYGPTNEPRNALFLAFAIGEAGILIAELDIIARVVSMVFLAMYGAVNITCVIESWASPDFRPTFRIPRVIAIIGAVACFLLMVQLDVVAMLGSTTLMLVAFLLLKRKQLSLESGDTWEGVWASIVRVGLHRLSRVTGQQRNWRPNILLFDEADHPKHGAIRSFASSLITGNGIATDFHLADKRSRSHQTEPKSDDASALEGATGMFDQTLVTSSPFETIRALTQHHGFSGLAPNTVLLPWRWHRGNPDEFFSSLNVAARSGLNLLLYEAAHDDDPGAPPASRAPRTIDAWWWPKSGSLALSVSLVRFITRAPGWENAQTRFLIVGTGIDDEDQLLNAKATQYIGEARLDATVRVMAAPAGGSSPHDLVVDTSRDADMCLVGLPGDLEHADVSLLEHLERIAAMRGGVVFLRPNKAFAKILQVAERTKRAETATDGGTVRVTALDLESIDHPELASTAGALYKHVSDVANELHQRLVARTYQWQANLIEQAQTLVDERYDAVTAAAQETNLTRRRARANRAISKYFADAGALIRDTAGEHLQAQATRLAADLTELLDDNALFPDAAPEVFPIGRPRADFAPGPDDSLALRAWKSRKRWRYFYRRSIPQTIHLGQFARYYHRELVCEVARSAVRQLEHDSQTLTVELAGLLSVADRHAVAHLNRQATLQSSELDLDAVLTQGRDATNARLAGLRERTSERIDDNRRAVAKRAGDVLRAMSVDLARIDVDDVIKRERRPAPIADLDALTEAPEQWRARIDSLLTRAQLAVGIASFRHQLTVSAVRTLEQLSAGVRSESLLRCSQVHAELVARRDGGAHAPEAVTVPPEPTYDGAPDVVRLAHAVAPMTAELPETDTTLTDEVVLALSHGDASALESVEISVRGGLQTLVETELISPLETEVKRIADLQSSAWIVVRDTVRVLAAHVEDDAEGDRESEGEAADRVAGTLNYSIERIEAETKRLGDLLARIDATVMDGLNQLGESTGMLSIAGSLSGASLRRQTKKPSKVVAAVRRGGAAARDLAARAMYRRSRGRARIEGAEKLRSIVSRAQVDTDVAKQLPPYYEHLFMGALNINEAFFVGRKRELATAIRVLSEPAPGQPQVVLVSGDRGSGKTALCRQITTAIKVPSVWVSPNPGDRASAEAFEAAFRAAVGERGPAVQLLAKLAPGTTVVIDDLDLWWERHPDGLNAIDAIVTLVRGAPSGIGFLLCGSAGAIRILDHLRPLSRMAISHLRCDALSAQQIRDVVMSRHTSTGLRMQLGKTDEDSLTEWSLARLFHAHYEASQGNVASSLRTWITHIDAVEDDVLHIRRPEQHDWDVLGALRPELVAILVELVIHKYAGIDKLERITNMSTSGLEDSVAELRGFGLVSDQRPGILQLAPQVQLPVIEWLKRGSLM